MYRNKELNAKDNYEDARLEKKGDTKNAPTPWD